jgi:hypothetical protein
MKLEICVCLAGSIIPARNDATNAARIDFNEGATSTLVALVRLSGMTLNIGE